MRKTKHPRSINHEKIPGKLFSCLMAIILVIGLMPKVALADDSYPDTDSPVLASPDNGTPVVDVGNVTVDAQEVGNIPAACAISDDSGDATVNVHGNVELTGNGGAASTAVSAESRGSSATVNVDGDVTVNVDSKPSMDTSSVNGVDASCETAGAETTVNVNGDVSAVINNASESHITSAGILQETLLEPSGAQSTSSVTVDGNVTAEANNPSGEARGIYVFSAGTASSNTVVKGDVVAKGEGASGISMTQNTLGFESDDTESVVSVGESITATSNIANGYATGIDVDNESGTVSIHIGGNVNATVKEDSGSSIGINAMGNAGETSILVEGIISAKTVGVADDTNGGRLEVTTWKIDSDIVGGKFDDEKMTYSEDETTERAINYIIRLEQPKEGNILGLIGTRVKEFAFGDETLSFDVANMGQKVYLNVDEGWVITAAFNGMGQKVPLNRDENGFYVVVPNGGGVYLTAQVAKKQHNDTPASGDVVTASGSVMPTEPCTSHHECTPNTGDACPGSTSIALIALGSLACMLFASRRMHRSFS